MEHIENYDYIMDIFQDFSEIESMTKILKDTIYNENKESTMNDIGNALEILLAKMCNTRKSLDIFINSNF